MLTRPSNVMLAVTALGVLSVLFAWASADPAPLAFAIAAIGLRFGWRIGLVVLLAVAACWLVLAQVQQGPEYQSTLVFVAFAGAGLVIASGVPRWMENSEKQTQRIVENMPGHGWTADANGYFLYLSPSTLAYTGTNIDDLDSSVEADAGWARFLHPDDVSRVVADWRHSLRTGEPYKTEHRLRRYDGAYRWFRNYGVSTRNEAGQILGWYGTTLDIDDEKSVELALRASEAHLRLLIDTLPTMIWAASPDGEPSYLNRRLMDYVGLTLADLDDPQAGRLRAAVTGSVHPDDGEQVLGALVKSFSTGSSFSMKYRQRRADGVYRWTDGRAEAIRNADGQVSQWYGVSFDINDEVEAQQALVERERELSQLVDMVPGLLWRLNPDGEPTYFSKQLTAFFGYQLHSVEGAVPELLAAIINKSVHPDDSPLLSQGLARSFETGKQFAMKYRLRRFDGVFRWMDSRAVPMHNSDGEIVQWYGLCSDIENEKTAQEALHLAKDRLSRATQAAGLAELSASIAHEINQPLAAILANSQAVERWMAFDPPNLERAKRSASAVVRDASSKAE